MIICNKSNNIYNIDDNSDAVGNNTDTEVKQLSLGFVKFEMKITEDHLQVQSLFLCTNIYTFYIKCRTLRTIILMNF